jgi:hypothetical protein
MKRSGTQIQRIGYNKVFHTVVFVFAMISFTLNNSNAWAATVTPTDYRVVAASGKYEDTTQYAVAFKIRPPRRLRARHLELAIGAISTSQEIRPFVSFGPVWRLPLKSQALFVEFGFSPTLIFGSSFNGRDLGGNFHFTSSASVGATFGTRENFSVALRVQHTSNGGLSGTNPGLDMIGLNFTFNLSV